MDPLKIRSAGAVRWPGTQDELTRHGAIAPESRTAESAGPAQ